jgi:glutamate synthase domain-containing protein 2
MMNEWGIPTVYLESLTYRMCEQLKAQGNYVPPIAIAGGLSLEDHIFKALALGAPYVKAICLGRALMAAAMVGKTNGNTALQKDQTEDNKDSERVFLSLFAVGAHLKERFGSEFKLIPAGAIGMYSYVDRLKQGLQQLMAGARKFAVEYIDRNDLVSLTREATDVSGIPYVMESDQRLVESIISGNGQPAIFVAKG